MSLIDAGSDLIIGLDFVHVEDEKAKNLPIKILTGEFADVVVEYNAVKFLDTDNGDAVMQFDYNIVRSAKFTDDELKSNDKFKQNIGDVLRAIIGIMAERGDFNEPKDRTDNPKGIDSK